MPPVSRPSAPATKNQNANKKNNKPHRGRWVPGNRNNNRRRNTYPSEKPKSGNAKGNADNKGQWRPSRRSSRSSRSSTVVEAGHNDEKVKTLDSEATGEVMSPTVATVESVLEEAKREEVSPTSPVSSEKDDVEVEVKPVEEM